MSKTCPKCGVPMEGNVCNYCGYDETKDASPLGTPNKGSNGKGFLNWIKNHKKLAIILGIVIVILLLGIIGSCGNSDSNSDSEKIDWSEMELGDMLPTPPSLTGTVWENTDEELKIDLDDVSDDEYSDYVEACEEMGYTVDAEKDDSSYEAYNEEGYKLDLSHLSDSLDITLDVPMEFSEITWPNSVVGKLLPAPKSLQGKFAYEHDTSFMVYIGETSETDYAEYVTTVQDAGFNVDYNKGDKYYYADNADGYHVSIEYEGFNIMSISIDSPDDSDTDEDLDDEDDLDDSDDSNSVDTSSMSYDDFKAFMDQYETFMNDYIAFMKKYNANPTDTSLLKEYAKMSADYLVWVAKADKIDEDSLTADELNYYNQVMTRVTNNIANAGL